ncbi:hypothetical protein M1L60_06120 [Actinoplanes sp. TRM 88003]|uniref:GNAT family N-acetyltransferase n=1 Tax=Paractinoplanes aksuensis TaxID=2939490 RepID=A0ABT1DH68_9ACTN|nr:hypothetical protein [Actinoplanes aksuensis]MCO8270167.1 hypothetical protein [Actinoplanes aksuensis]
MSNSRVARIHTTDDPHTAFRLTRQLLAWSDRTCNCPRDVGAWVWTTTHELGRYLDLGDGGVMIDRPDGPLPEVVAHLFPEGRSRPVLDLTPRLADTLRQLPNLTAQLSTPEFPLDGGLDRRALAAAGDDPVRISWTVCWPMDHSRAGFELGLNGADVWLEENRPGHSVFVHSSWAEMLPEVAAAVGCQVLSGPEVGW